MIYLGADHAGYALKEKIKSYLAKKKIAYKDLGIYTQNSVDASDYAIKVARKIKKDKKNRGILICGSGIMMSMAANRIKGVRAALAFDARIARQAREHNDANILVLSGRESSPKDWRKIVDVFLKTKFSGKKRYLRRIKKLDKIR